MIEWSVVDWSWAATTVICSVLWYYTGFARGRHSAFMEVAEKLKEAE